MHYGCMIMIMELCIKFNRDLQSLVLGCGHVIHGGLCCGVRQLLCGETSVPITPVTLLLTYRSSQGCHVMSPLLGYHIIPFICDESLHFACHSITSEPPALLP